MIRPVMNTEAIQSKRDYRTSGRASFSVGSTNKLGFGINFASSVAKTSQNVNKVKGYAI